MYRYDDREGSGGVVDCVTPGAVFLFLLGRDHVGHIMKLHYCLTSRRQAI